ncbi:MAG: flagellar hook-associated protein FlgK [Lachnospiraceae bacterium]
MPSQFFGLNIAYSGLTASNVGLNTTGNNISNIETKGYSRQQVSQQAMDALRTFSTYGCAGAGVDTIAVERMRDQFYDVKYQTSNTNAGEYDKKQYYMKQIENYFKDDGKTMKGFATIFSEMYDALASLKNSPGDVTLKTQFLGKAQSLTDYFNNLSGNLEKSQKDANAEIKVKTDQINALAEEIASLNKQINSIELKGTIANELRDRRTVLVDQLSAIVDISTTETPIHDTNDPTRVTGANTFVVRIAGGQELVDTGEYNTLKCVARAAHEKVNQSDVDGLYDVKWENGSNFGMYSDNLGGELKALLELRDGNNGVNFQGLIGAVNTINDAASPDNGKQTVSIDVTAGHLKDLDKSTLPTGGGVINLGNQLYHYDSWSYTADTTKTPPTYSYTFVLSDTNKTKVSAAEAGKEASIGDSIKYQGIPYYMQQMNEWVRGFSAEFNKLLTQENSVDGNGDPASNCFTGNHATDSKQFGFTTSYDPEDPANLGKKYTVSSKDDSYYRLTAHNFDISAEMLKDPNKLATHTNQGTGEDSGADKSDILDDLIDLKTNTKKMNFRGGSASTFLHTILADVSLNAENANTFYSNYNSITKTIDIQRLSVSGVDKDEEAINLVKYQNSYTLASKMIQTLTEVYDRLILQTGV